MAGKPHIQFYLGDYLRDSVSGCSLAAQGLWLRLLFIAHDSDVHGQIFATDLLDAKRAIIARRCGCALHEFDEVFSELLDADVPGIEDGHYVSRRMMRAASISVVRAKAGRKGGKQKSSKRSEFATRSAKAKRKQNADNDNVIDSDTVIDASPFSIFWNAVPNKVGRRGAEKAYNAAVRVLESRGELDPHGLLLSAVTLFAASPIGRGETQFIPHPATWLNNGRYDDDPSTWVRRNDPRGVGSAMEQYLKGSNGNS